MGTQIHRTEQRAKKQTNTKMKNWPTLKSQVNKYIKSCNIHEESLGGPRIFLQGRKKEI